MLKNFILYLLFVNFSLFAQTQAENINNESSNAITYETAFELYKKGEYARSSSVIKALSKESYQTYYLDGHNNLKLGKTRTATAKFYKSLELKDNPLVIIDLAKLLINRNQIADAKELLTKGVINHPEIVDLKLLHALALYKSKNTKSALQIIEQLKSLKGSSVKPLLIEALIYYRMAEFDKAEMSLKWAMEIDPGNPEVFNNLALVYEKIALTTKQDIEKVKKLEDARYYIEKAKELDGTNSSIAKNFARIVK